MKHKLQRFAIAADERTAVNRDRPGAQPAPWRVAFDGAQARPRWAVCVARAANGMGRRPARADAI